MKRFLIGFALFALVAPLAALPEPTADEVQANRRRFEQLRKQHPEVVAKLRADAEAFFALPQERRKQIVRIHKELHQESAATQARLYNVLDRYVDWLDDLDVAMRKKIGEDKDGRLALIVDLREQQWIKDQPKALRDQIAGLQGDARKALIAREKAVERQRRLEWLIASRFWNELEGENKFRKTLPTKFAELPPGVRFYVENYLHKMFLSQDEKDQLARLEGQPWPQYPMKLVELADKHPAALPGPLGPKALSELPKDVLRKLNLLKKDLLIPPAKKDGRLAEGKWPEFGVSLVKFAKQRGVTSLDFEFLAWDRDCLTPVMQEFMKNKLEPVLNRDELQRLYDAIGKWPDFPRTIQDLANNHHLHVPWLILPRGENWDNYRLHKTSSLYGIPEVPRGGHPDFAVFELVNAKPEIAE